MNRNILILNGSPRMKGNTAMLCDAFAKGAQEAGHAVLPFMRGLPLRMRMFLFMSCLHFLLLSM